MIEDDSPFRKLPLRLAPKQVLAFDAIRYSAEIASLAYGRLVDQLIEVTQLSRTRTTFDLQFPAIFADAWTIVDALNRLRAVARGIPGFEKADFGLEFLQTTDSVRVLRNGVQHLHSRFDWLVSQSLPAWGALTWVALRLGEDGGVGGLTSFVIVSGSTRSFTQTAENPAGVELCGPIDLVKLHAYGAVTSLTELLRTTERSIRQLEKVILQHMDPMSHHGSDLMFAIEMDFRDEPEQGHE